MGHIVRTVRLPLGVALMGRSIAWGARAEVPSTGAPV
jgi:hypothetical protein